MVKEPYRKNLTPWLNGRTMMFIRLYAANIAPATWIILMSSFMLTGCGDTNWTLKDFYYGRTQGGYQRCLDKNKDVGVSEKTIRSLCLDKHEQSYNGPFLGSNNWTSEYLYGDDKVRFFLRIRNYSKDMIITSIDISLAHKKNIGSDGKPIHEKLYASNLWIEPRQAQSIEFSNQFEPPIGSSGKDSYEWHVPRVGGLRIVLR